MYKRQDYTSALESYLLRRAVCGLTTKNYNRVFLTMTRALRKDGTSPANLRNHLLSLTGDSTAWPTDAQFGNAWMTTHAYAALNNPKLVHIFRRPVSYTHLDVYKRQLMLTHESAERSEVVVGLILVAIIPAHQPLA